MKRKDLRGVRKNHPASGREMASYKLNNLVKESPAFERFIFINLSVRKWSFFGQKNLSPVLNPGF